MKQKWKSTTSFFIVILFFSFACTKNAEKENGSIAENENEVLEAQEFKSKLSAAPDAVLVDVRTPEELSDGMIEGAINVDFKDPQFTEKINALDKEKTYFVYCLSGMRSAKAVEQMKEAGFKNIYTLNNGLKSWKAEGLETVKP